MSFRCTPPRYGSLNPLTVPTDNGNITSIVVQSQGGFTGMVSVNNTSGVVSLASAAPLSGPFTITIRATDNCGSTTNATFQVTVTTSSASFNLCYVADGTTKVIRANSAGGPWEFYLAGSVLYSGTNAIVLQNTASQPMLSDTTASNNSPATVRMLLTVDKRTKRATCLITNTSGATINTLTDQNYANTICPL